MRQNLLQRILLFGCFGILQQSTDAQAVPAFSHIVVVIGENTSASSVFGNANAPYINALAAEGAMFTNSYGVTHPSQPNYLDLYAGSAQGVTDDSKPPSKFTTANIGAELISASKTYSTYSEGLPAIGDDVDNSGNYARKHNPAVNWMGSGANQIPAGTNQPFTAFPSDFNNLPNVSFVIPDLCNDGHNICPPISNSVKQYDSWVQMNLDAYKKWCSNNNSLLIVTYDEDDYTGSNKIATVFYGAHVATGSYTQTINHYNVLRTVEDANMLLTHAGLAASATPINFSWSTAMPVNLVSFIGKKQNGGTLLWWNIASESNFLEFQIERSSNGYEFQKIADVASNGSRDYSFLDPKPISGINFYRLKLTDRDGSARISNIITLDYNHLAALTILPNPVFHRFHINSTDVFTEAKLLAINGALLRTWQNVSNASMLDVGDLKKGIYILKLISKNASTTLRLVKE